ncbi:MAG: translation elongation factor 4 [Anaplasmataceae bacterium]|nr:translation elongation factor 4 [Anaplasmataceae bacterium]
MNHIRNFVIIAHIDSGKSTLADRLLEVTKTVETRLMKPQYLDQLSLERERGITIKMAPVKMQYEGYQLHLIDTPGHSDFSYEVSRALKAVEGALLLVDITKGIQAQTLANFRFAKSLGLRVVGAVNKIDMPSPNAEKIISLLAKLIDQEPENIVRVSAKTGEGVEEVLKKVVADVPPPVSSGNDLQGLIFDSQYDDHKGIIAYVRIMGGKMKAGDKVQLSSNGKVFEVKEVGSFSPRLAPGKELAAGEIGYVATGLKEPALVNIGDTLVLSGSSIGALKGYREPKPVVFVSFYPLGTTVFEDLRQALGKLRLNDAALSFEPESNELLGRGFKVGFLGQLHFEITASRLRDEFGADFSTSLPSVAYRIIERGVERIIKQPAEFPEKPDKVFQPMIQLDIVTPPEYLNGVLGLTKTYKFQINETKNFGDDLLLVGTMPLAELMRGFDNTIKSVTAGYASFSYELIEEESAEVEKLEILVNEESIPALARVVPRDDAEREGREMVERLRDLLPKQQFKQPIQAKAWGRIIARETIPALTKKLGDFGKNGGDVTRKMKLWRKQKRGKEKLQDLGRVSISPEVIREILKKSI